MEAGALSPLDLIHGLCEFSGLERINAKDNKTNYLDMIPAYSRMTHSKMSNPYQYVALVNEGIHSGSQCKNFPT